jgi:hypothetical protein
MAKGSTGINFEKLPRPQIQRVRLVIVDIPVFIFLLMVILLGVLFWIYEHPPRDRGKRNGRGGDFEE